MLYAVVFCVCWVVPQSPTAAWMNETQCETGLLHGHGNFCWHFGDHGRTMENSFVTLPRRFPGLQHGSPNAAPL